MARRAAQDRFCAILAALVTRWVAATEANDRAKARRIDARYHRLIVERHHRIVA